MRIPSLVHRGDDDTDALENAAGSYNKAALIAESVSLVFPLYRSTSLSEDPSLGRPETDSRMLLSASGKISGIRVLDDISFTLTNGDRLAIIGRNGSGKTSLLQVLSGAIPPDSGQVICRGRPTSLININIGMMAEATGHRNITLRGLAAGHSHHEIELRRPEITEFTQLGDFLDMPVSIYSSGMRMRLSFAIATAFRPEVLILDEWLSAGDALFRESATQRMQEFVKDAGILILASHNRKLLKDNCSKALWLERGRIMAYGEIDEVLKSYDNAMKINK